MRGLLLIFLITVLILLIGLFFGYAQINKSFDIAESVQQLAVPFGNDFDQDFIRKKSFN